MPLWLEHARNLAEGQRQLRLEEARASLPAALLLRVRHNLAGLRRERGSEEVGVEVAHGALQPDVEEVGEVGVRHIVVVGRVGQHRVEEGVRVRQARGGGMGDHGWGMGHGWGRIRRMGTDRSVVIRPSVGIRGLSEWDTD
ncbi:MAG: hypothetical protein RMJ48_03760 [Roseiflexaceae bacterium]|nr:hypothetical protein [Roseiflexaceae bacterium]